MEGLEGDSIGSDRVDFASCFQRQSDPYDHGSPILRLGLNFPLMGIDNGLRQGETDAVASVFGISGSIRPVEAVEDPWQVLFLDEICSIIDREIDLVILPGQADLDPSVVIGIFDGIIQEDPNQLTNGLLVTEKIDHGLNINVEGLLCQLGSGPEGLGRLRHHIGEGKVYHDKLCTALIHSGQVDKIPSQACHSLGLLLQIR